MQALVLVLLGDAIGTMPGGFDRALAGKLGPLGLRFRDLVAESRDRWIAAFDWERDGEFGRLSRHPDLKRAVHAIFDPLGIDFFLLSDSVYFAKKKLVAFDLDSTLVQAEGIDELAREMGAYEAVARVTERAMRGEIEFERSFAERVACLAGLTAAQIESVRARVKLNPGVGGLLRAIRAAGAETIILSGGFEPLAELVRRAGPVAWTATNRLEMENGACTGGFVEPVIDGAAKAELLRRRMDERGLSPAEVIAVGDGSNDVAMLEVAGLGVSYRGKPRLNEVADGVLTSPDLSRIAVFLT